MLTNQLGVQFHVENIERDFTIYRITKTEPPYGMALKQIIESIKDDEYVLSTRFLYGNQALLLLKKQSDRSFLKNIMKNHHDILVEEYHLNDDFDQRGIAQLLFNSLSAENFHNIFGKLWYLYEEREEYLKFIEIHLEQNMFLKLNIITLKKNDKGPFALTPCGSLRHATNDDQIRYDYKRENNRESLDIINISSYQNFSKTKLGVFCNFWMDAKENLKEYLTLSLKTLDMNTEKIKLPSFSITDMKKVILVDLLEDESYLDEKKAIVEVIEEFGINVEIGNFTTGECHISLIHEKKFYNDHNLEDDYKKGDFVCQHLTIESCHKPKLKKKDNENDESFDKRKNRSTENYRKTLALIISKVLYELRIKKDIHEKKITITPWNNEEWNFVIRKRTEENVYEYNKLTISSDCTMTYQKMKENSGTLDDEWLEIFSAYDSISYPAFMIDGVFYKDIEHINYIVATNGRAFVHADKIHDVLKELNKKISIQFILSLKDNFLSLHPEYEKDWLNWSAELEELPEKTDAASIRKAIKIRTNAGKSFSKYLENEHDIFINGGFRTKENDPLYAYASLEGLQYTLCEDGFLYFVGEQNGKESCAKFNVIRHVITEDITLDDFLPFLKVPFIRNNQYTVLPYPFKFLREYMDL